MVDRAQAVTLEAFLAGLLVVGALLFALQTQAVPSSSASSADPHVRNQHERLASGVLDAAIANDTLEPTLLYWNETNASFHDVNRNGYYVTGGPPTRFGRLADRALDDQGLVYNVHLSYLSRDGQPRRVALVYAGAPSATAVTVSRTVLLTDDDVLYDRSGTPTNTTLTQASTYFAPDASPTSPTYNAVRVEVVVWRG